MLNLKLVSEPKLPRYKAHENFVTGMYLHYKEQKYNNFKRRFLHLNKTMEKNIV
jgi:hypothetical protein